MTTRAKRFHGALAELEGSTEPAPEGGGLGPHWLQASGVHPIDGRRIARMVGLRHHPDRVGGGDRAVLEVAFAATASRAAGSPAEAACGVVLRHQLRFDPRLALAPPECVCGVFCAETARAFAGTAQIRVGWKLDARTAAPGVERLRGRPAFGTFDQIVILLEAEMPDGWSEGVSERPEAVLTARAAAWHATDTLTLGVPWLHRDGELVVTFALEEIRQAALRAVALVA